MLHLPSTLAILTTLLTLALLGACTPHRPVQEAKVWCGERSYGDPDYPKGCRW